MKKIVLSLCLLIACAGMQAQFVFKTEYFGTSRYRMTEGDTDERVGDSKGSARVYRGGLNLPLSVKLDSNDRPTSWSIGALPTSIS